MRTHVPAPQAAGNTAGNVPVQARRAGAVDAVLAIGAYLKASGTSLIDVLDKARRAQIEAKRRFYFGG
jgi:hypothetical protein